MLDDQQYGLLKEKIPSATMSTSPSTTVPAGSESCGSQFREVAQQRLPIAAVEVHLVAPAEDSEAVPLRFVRPTGRSRQHIADLRLHRSNRR